MISVHIIIQPMDNILVPPRSVDFMSLFNHVLHHSLSLATLYLVLCQQDACHMVVIGSMQLHDSDIRWLDV